MSEQWQAFLRRDGEDSLLILTDVGIHDQIDTLAPATLVRIDLPIASEDGYPSEALDEALNAIEDDINPRLAELGSVYVGRITRAGMRSLFHYAPVGEPEVEALVVELEKRFDTKAGSYVGADPDHLVYKSMLYPTLEEWSLIHDFGVFEQLGDNGDERDEAREVTHFAYFPDHAKAVAFESFVEAAGYRDASIEERLDNEPEARIVVRFARDDTPAYGPFTEANIGLRKAAREHGGSYDGWETMVVRKLQ